MLYKKNIYIILLLCYSSLFCASSSEKTIDIIQKDSSIFDICISGNLELFKQKLSNNYNLLYERLDNDISLAYIAVYYGYVDILDYILEIDNTIIKSLMPNGNNILHVACTRGNLGIVKYIMNKDIKLAYSINNNIYIPIHVACSHGYIDLVEYFLDFDINLATYRTLDNITIMHLACWFNFPDIVMCIYNKYNDSINDLTVNGQSILHIAAEKGFLEIAQFVLKCNPKLLYKKDNLNFIPLFKAINYGKYDIVKCFLSYEPDLINNLWADCTLAHLAAFYGHVDILDFILKLKPNLINVLDKDNSNLLHIAVMGNHLNMVNFILNLKPDFIFKKDDAGKLPMHYACELYSFDIVKLLIDAYPNSIFEQDNEKLTPMNIACEANNVQLLYFFLNLGYDSMENRLSGAKPLFYTACLKQSREVVLFLLKEYPGCINEMYDKVYSISLLRGQVLMQVLFIIDINYERYKDFKFKLKYLKGLDIQKMHPNMPVYLLQNNIFSNSNKINRRLYFFKLGVKNLFGEELSKYTLVDKFNFIKSSLIKHMRNLNVDEIRDAKNSFKGVLSRGQFFLMFLSVRQIIDLLSEIIDSVDISNSTELYCLSKLLHMVRSEMRLDYELFQGHKTLLWKALNKGNIYISACLMSLSNNLDICIKNGISQVDVTFINNLKNLMYMSDCFNKQKQV